jgi:hypothetical protein
MRMEKKTERVSSSPVKEERWLDSPRLNNILYIMSEAPAVEAALPPHKG